MDNDEDEPNGQARPGIVGRTKTYASDDFEDYSDPEGFEEDDDEDAYEDDMDQFEESKELKDDSFASPAAGGEASKSFEDSFASPTPGDRSLAEGSAAEDAVASPAHESAAASQDAVASPAHESAAASQDEVASAAHESAAARAPATEELDEPDVSPIAAREPSDEEYSQDSDASPFEDPNAAASEPGTMSATFDSAPSPSHAETSAVSPTAGSAASQAKGDSDESAASPTAGSAASPAAGSAASPTHADNAAVVTPDAAEEELDAPAAPTEPSSAEAAAAVEVDTAAPPEAEDVTPDAAEEELEAPAASTEPSSVEAAAAAEVDTAAPPEAEDPAELKAPAASTEPSSAEATAAVELDTAAPPEAEEPAELKAPAASTEPSSAEAAAAAEVDRAAPPEAEEPAELKVPAASTEPSSAEAAAAAEIDTAAPPEVEEPAAAEPESVAAAAELATEAAPTADQAATAELDSSAAAALEDVAATAEPTKLTAPAAESATALEVDGSAAEPGATAASAESSGAQALPAATPAETIEVSHPNLIGAASPDADTEDALEEDLPEARRKEKRAPTGFAFPPPPDEDEQEEEQQRDATPQITLGEAPEPSSEQRPSVKFQEQPPGDEIIERRPSFMRNPTPFCKRRPSMEDVEAGQEEAEADALEEGLAARDRRPSVTFDGEAPALERRPSWIRKPTPFHKRRPSLEERRPSLEIATAKEDVDDDLASPHARFSGVPEGEKQASRIRDPTPYPGKHAHYGEEEEEPDKEEAQRASLSERRPSWSGQPAPLAASRSRTSTTGEEVAEALEIVQHQREEAARAAAQSAAQAPQDRRNSPRRSNSVPTNKVRDTAAVKPAMITTVIATPASAAPPLAAAAAPVAGGASPARSAEESQVAMRQEAHPILGKSSSLPAVAQRKPIATHLRPKAKVRKRKLPPPQQLQSWDDRHQLCGVENELLPKTLRAYFSAPQSLPELREELKRKKKQMPSMLRRFDAPEKPALGASPLTSDAEPTICPERHALGGIMKDRDNEVRSWNNRWASSIGQLNDGMHPLHRQYFSQDSLFATAPSQRWRRYMDTEIEHGVWKTNDTNRPKLFPPLGV